jgi:hypothetical protein
VERVEEKAEASSKAHEMRREMQCETYGQASAAALVLPAALLALLPHRHQTGTQTVTRRAHRHAAKLRIHRELRPAHRNHHHQVRRNRQVQDQLAHRRNRQAPQLGHRNPLGRVHRNPRVPGRNRQGPAHQRRLAPGQDRNRQALQAAFTRRHIEHVT